MNQEVGQIISVILIRFCYTFGYQNMILIKQTRIMLKDSARYGWADALSPIILLSQKTMDLGGGQHADE